MHKDNMDDLGKILHQRYGPFRKKKFTGKQKEQLRPIAEVLALLDGNAFFGMSLDESGEDNWYEQYLPEAWSIFNANGGMKGWVSMTSWMRDLEHENDTVRDAHAQWRLLKKLSRGQSSSP
jgi:hypothetical protein